MHKFDRLAALYTALIAIKPDDPARYIARAAFYEASFQRTLALADLDKAISLDGSANTHLQRAALLEALGDKTRAAADYQAALGIDSSSRFALTQLGLLQIDAGRKTEALAPIEEHLAGADEDKPDWLEAKAELLARTGDAEGALAAMNAAIAIKPANANLFNQRCWIEGTLDVHLDGAVQDCTRAIELAENNANALDSRAMAYYRLNRLDDALADLNAALDRAPTRAPSLYLRAVIERKVGKSHDADQDAANARLLSPRIDEEYARWKIKA